MLEVQSTFVHYTLQPRCFFGLQGNPVYDMIQPSSILGLQGNLVYDMIQPSCIYWQQHTIVHNLMQPSSFHLPIVIKVHNMLQSRRVNDLYNIDQALNIFFIHIQVTIMIYSFLFYKNNTVLRRG